MPKRMSIKPPKSPKGGLACFILCSEAFLRVYAESFDHAQDRLAEAGFGGLFLESL
jgi:hypothetical protein